MAKPSNGSSPHWLLHKIFQKALPQSYHISHCLLTFSYLPNTYLHVPSCWLAKPHNSPSCLITHKLGAPVQLVMSSNWLNCIGYHEWAQWSHTSTTLGKVLALMGYLVHKLKTQTFILWLDTWYNY